jgi:hypothetical protein
VKRYLEKAKREVKVIERINDNVIYAVKEYDELKTIKMRKNVLFLVWLCNMK